MTNGLAGRRPRGACNAATARLAACCLLAALGLGFESAHATEGGGSVYPYGLNTVASGVLPKPGPYLYVVQLVLHRRRHDDQRRATGRRCRSTSTCASTRCAILRVHPTAKLFGGSVGWLVAQPYLIGDASIGPREDYDSGVGDTTVGLMLGWHGRSGIR